MAPLYQWHSIWCPARTSGACGAPCRNLVFVLELLARVLLVECLHGGALHEHLCLKAMNGHPLRRNDGMTELGWVGLGWSFRHSNYYLKQLMRLKGSGNLKN